MKKRAAIVTTVLVAILITATPVLGSPAMGALDPGEFVVFDQTIPVNIVFLGYDEEAIDEDALLDELPAEYEPLVRYPDLYGIEGRPLGLRYDFEYDIKYASSKLERRFFKYLQKKGTPGPLTVFMDDYNAQVNNVLEVSAPVLYIDALSVERWLKGHTRGLGIDIKHSYTIFFINWYSRDDFKFHVYTKTNEPDPDTGYNFGEQRDSRKMIAFGGSRNSRVWFYDLSAGPEAWTDNWNVDTPDLNGNGIEDYRMPPIWEYSVGGYRDPVALSSDLGLVSRYVGIDLLFTTSPLYDPLITAPGRIGDKVLHVEMFEDDPGDSGLNWITPDHIKKKLRKFQPYYDWKVYLEDNDPIDPSAEQSFRIFTYLDVVPECWQGYGTPFAQLYCYFDANLGTYVPAYGPKDYVGEVFAFNTTDANMGAQLGLLGFADDNWTDGTQTYVFQFDTPWYRTLGYGFSDTTVHEFGHHIGMSHPHDGYDYEDGIHVGPGDDFYFIWSGDESNTVMSYISLSGGFSQFDRDNMYRWEMAGYLNWANALLDDVLAHPDVDKVKGLLDRADDAASVAISDFANWKFSRAVSKARRAHNLVTKAAERLGIPYGLEAFGMRYIPPTSEAPHEGDPIRFPDN
jgi:hypothetical protein